MMNAVRARKYEHLASVSRVAAEPAVHETARVLVTSPLRLRGNGVEYSAERAVSCLVEPRVGDEVYVALLADRRAFVLAVLERSTAGVEIAVEGDCTLRASGALGMAAPEGLSFVTGKDMEVVAGRFTLDAAASRLASSTVELVARTVSAELDKARVAARVVDGFFDRVTQRAKRALRIVEEADQLRAGRVDYVAESTMTLNADNTVITAGELVKVDGSQIQLG